MGFFKKKTNPFGRAKPHGAANALCHARLRRAAMHGAALPRHPVFLQMPASMGNYYYYLFIKYVSLLSYNLQQIFVTVFRGRRKLRVH
jgi:hypothetical protein